MGTTTKMAIPYPEATGLVKDGWEDMKDIATQVDAKSGLVFINTTTFSAVSSQSVNNVFTSSFTNYLIQLNIDSASTGLDLAMRLRAAGTDNSSSNYGFSGYVTYSYNSTQAHLAGNLQTSFDIARLLQPGGYCEITLFSPQKSQETAYFARGTRFDTTTPNNSSYQHTGGMMTVTTSYDGFTLICNSGNMTGSVSVFGVNA